MESLDEALTESLRVLKPGGLFLADVIHSRFSVRTLGITASFMGSLLYHIITRQISKVCTLYPAYFQEHYENDLNHQDYNDLLRRRGMEDVRVQVCRPFPPLALSGWADGRYTQLMMKLGGLWNWFDSSDSPISRRLGWMYLISARKPA